MEGELPRAMEGSKVEAEAEAIAAVCVCVSELLRASSSWMRSGTRKSFKMRKTQYDKHVGNTNGDCVDETQM